MRAALCAAFAETRRVAVVHLVVQGDAEALDSVLVAAQVGSRTAPPRTQAGAVTNFQSRPHPHHTLTPASPLPSPLPSPPPCRRQIQSS